MANENSLQLIISLTKRQRDAVNAKLSALHTELIEAQQQLKRLEIQSLSFIAPQSKQMAGISSQSHAELHYSAMFRLQHAIDLQVEIISNINEQQEKERLNLKNFDLHLAKLANLLQTSFNKNQSSSLNDAPIQNRSAN